MAEMKRLNRVFFSIGSNIDAEHNLPAAVRMLRSFGVVTAASMVYETLPVGFADQPNFLNVAVLFETQKSLAEVLDSVVPSVERALERVRDPSHPDGPRTIDIDVLLFNDEVTRTDRHILPDPDILKHAFVAVPLAELDPDFVHPVAHETLAAIAARSPIRPGDMHPRPDVHLG